MGTISFLIPKVEIFVSKSYTQFLVPDLFETLENQCCLSDHILALH